MYVGPNDGNAAGVMADNILGLIFLRGGGRLLTVACPYFLPHSTLLAGRFRAAFSTRRVSALQQPPIASP